jgi:hypothetical protein
MVISDLFNSLGFQDRRTYRIIIIYIYVYIYIEDYTLTTKNLEHLAKVNWDRFPYTLTLIWPM